METASLNHEVLLKPAKSDIKKFLKSWEQREVGNITDSLLNLQDEKFINAIALLSTKQCIELIELLLDRLHDWISLFENETMNIGLLQGITAILCSILSNCRLLCPTVPKASYSSFKLLLDRMKDELAIFGSVILQRTHVRAVMQSFLRLCHIWGDLNVLTRRDDTFSISSDSSDLSSTLPFLTSHQWSVVTERISNFGDQLCNKLLVQLLLQKLEITQHINNTASEPAGKHLVERFSPYLQDSVSSVMNQEQLNMVVNSLPDESAYPLVATLFTQLLQEDDLLRWTNHPHLLENRRFNSALLQAALRSLISFYGESSTTSRELLNAVQEMSLQNVGDLDNLRELLNSALDTKRNDSARDLKFAEKVCKAVAHLPFPYIVSDNNALMYCAATMVCLDLGDQLFPVFERLLSISQNVTACFHVGRMISWVASHVSDRECRTEITELLVRNGTANAEGMKQFKTLVKSLKRDSSCLETSSLLETQVNLHVSIRKCWREKKDPISIEYNAVLAKQRKRLTKQVRSTLESQTPSPGNCHEWVLLDAFTIDLRQRHRENVGKQLNLLNFDTFLEIALNCLKTGQSEEGRKASINLLTAVLAAAKSLRSRRHPELALHIFNELNGCECPDSLWEAICAAATPTEMTKIMNKVVKAVLPTLRPQEFPNIVALPIDLRHLQILEYQLRTTRKPWEDYYPHVWKVFLRKAEGDKLKICCDAVMKLSGQPECTMPVTENVLDGSLLKWLRFLHFIATHQKVVRKPSLDKFLLHVLLTIPSDLSHSDYFPRCIDLLTALVSSKRSGSSVRYPAIVFLVFKKLLDWLLAQHEGESSIQAGFLFEKLIGLFVQRKQELRLVFFLQEIINAVVTREIQFQVKMHIKNCAFALLRGLDDKSCLSLQVSLPPGCREVFKGIHAEYRKFYKFRGKV